MRGRYLLGLSNANRQAAGVEIGDEVEVELEFDPEPRFVAEPADFARALSADPIARAAYDRLPDGRKGQHVRAIENAKKPETRMRRIEKTLAALRDSESGSSATSKTPTKGFTADERAAMKARAQELKAEARASRNKADGERDALAAIAAMHEPDRAMAERLHSIITASAPDLAAKTWYGMPAYAKDGKVVCFFQSAEKFKSRYATLGFGDPANLDEGAMWPTSFALKELSAAAEAKIAALVKKAVS
jgi:uncharacterized protein YdhG (YjbR/CyaY superfamily)